MKISVIVPIYNVKDFMEQCVNSIINQTYKELEIILVNDGSTDGSKELCDNYINIDNRIIVIHKENGGLSSARNAGLDIATGDLISFIDSDDWIESDFLQILYHDMVTYNTDISVLQFIKVNNYEKIAFDTEWISKSMKLDRKQGMKAFLSSNDMGYSAVNKLYKRKLFNKVRYPEGMLMEDKATTYKLIHESNSISINYSKKYHYYLRPNSIMRCKFNRRMFDAFIIHEELISFIQKKYPDLESLVKSTYIHAAIRMIFNMIKNNHKNKEDYEKTINIIKDNFKHLKKTKEVRYTIKIIAYVFYYFPNLPYIMVHVKIIRLYLAKLNIS